MEEEKVNTYYIPTIINFLEKFKENPLQYSAPLNKNQKSLVLRDYDWFMNNYIIDLNKSIDFDAFSHKNPKYMYTPKIYKIHDNLYEETFIANASVTALYKKSELFKILKKLLDINIGVELEPATIRVIKQKERKTVKFTRFYYTDYELLDLAEYYYEEIDNLYED